MILTTEQFGELWWRWRMKCPWLALCCDSCPTALVTGVVAAVVEWTHTEEFLHLNWPNSITLRIPPIMESATPAELYRYPLPINSTTPITGKNNRDPMEQHPTSNKRPLQRQVDQQEFPRRSTKHYRQKQHRPNPIKISMGTEWTKHSIN